ncbi:MAG: GAF domain-containing protein [Kaiparowitsia implicata GSE-PSE-MK54-09C]|jgi:GAF domain-containing protein/anti-sigma regulatory factor (Ser/Thr protein kinase)|nr:GAF domain-containing protein [Kaiparowitsia implicata GSE-PSE-MK54-09C]
MGSPKKPTNYEQQLAALRQTLQTLQEAGNEDGLIAAILTYLKAEFDYALLWVGAYDRVRHRLVGKGGVTPAGDLPVLRQQMALNPGDLMEQVVIQQRPVGVPDLREETRAGEWRRVAQKLAIQGTVIFPIRHRDCCLGVIVLGSSLWGVSPHAEEKARLSIVLGALAASLYLVEEERKRQQTKRPEEPLLALLNKLRSLPNLQTRLETVVDETNRFIAPDRTNVYWFEAERRYFWRRVGNREGSYGNTAAGFTAQEVNSFYQSLAADQLVSIGEAHSSLKTEMTGRLMQQIKARSLLAAPILLHNELYGFLAVEGNEPRIWSEEEKRYIRGAAQLIALTAPLEGMEETIQQVKQDQALTSDLTRAIFSDEDWKLTIRNAAATVCQRLRADWFLVLLYDSEQEQFNLCFQQQPAGRRPIQHALNGLNQVDWQMLERSPSPIAIENLEEDLKLMAWRDVLLGAGVRSLLVCSSTVERPLEGVVVVGHNTARTWSRTEREVLRVVSQQIGVILHQWHLQQQSEQQQSLNQTIQWGLTTMQHTQDLDALERAAMQQLSQMLNVPMAALLTWQPGRKSAKVSAVHVNNVKFSLNQDISVSLQTDLLLQWVLKSEGLLSISIDDIDVETRQWLNGADIGQLLVMALRTSPEHEPYGIAIAADRLDRYWSERQLNTMTSLMGQLAWSRRHLLLTQLLTERKGQLEQLNWYKHRRLEEMYRILGVGVKRLNDMGTQPDALSSMRHQQVLRHLGSLLASMSPMLKNEQWQFHSNYETVALPSLLKRSLERVESLIKQRQLWSQVHNDGTVNIGGDIAKIELVLCELLTLACLRSPSGGRLDIWCRALDARWLELSITDHGIIEPRLLEELHMGRSPDLLAPSILNNPPGLHLAVCQAIMQQLSSEFTLYRLEDGRILSRLVLPIAAQTPPSRPQS